LFKGASSGFKLFNQTHNRIMKKLLLAVAIISLLIGACARGRVETQKTTDSSTVTQPDTTKHK
jgi:hypothetical protein